MGDATMPSGQTIAAPKGLIGFDANAALTFEQARAFYRAGYRYVLRYVPRMLPGTPHDLSAAEVVQLFLAGLAVMPVQHVESEKSWTPTDDKGREYGQAAVEACLAAGIALGTTVWLDLEGVAPGTSPEQVIRYCNLWHDAVAANGFEPGIYVGWHSGLTAVDLYGRLKFSHYWSAYNLNGDEYPITCGVSMKQHAAADGDKPSGIPFEIDTDVVVGDKLGRFPTLFAPTEWSAV